MATFRELMQKMVNYSYEELVGIGRSSFHELLPAFEAFFDGAEEDADTNAIIVLIAACLGVDGKLTELEWRFTNDLLEANHSYDTLHAFVSRLSGSEAEELIDSLADTLEEKARMELLTLVLCFLAVDETITAKETAFVRKLLE